MKCPKCGCDRVYRRRSADGKGSLWQQWLTIRVCCHNCLHAFRRLRLLNTPQLAEKSGGQKKVA